MKKTELIELKLKTRMKKLNGGIKKREQFDSSKRVARLILRIVRFRNFEIRFKKIIFNNGKK